MSEAIRDALQNHLKALDPTFRTQIENAKFVPDATTPFQRVQMLYAEPDNAVLGCARHREVGVFQVGLHYPYGTNYGAAQTKAEQIRIHFKRGTTLSSAGQNVLITRTPSKATLGIIDDRYVVIVSIYYSSDVIA